MLFITVVFCLALIVRFLVPAVALYPLLRSLKWIYYLRMRLFARRRRKLLHLLETIKKEKQALVDEERHCKHVLDSLEQSAEQFNQQAGRYIDISP